VVNDNAGFNLPANPAIAVNGEGVVGVTFNDRRDDPKTHCYRLYFAASVDGGATFLPNKRVSDAPTCPLEAGNWAPVIFSIIDVPLDVSKERRRRLVSMSVIPSRFQNGGDTQGLAASPDGAFHAAWIGSVSGVMQLRYQRLTVEGAAVLRRDVAAAREDLTEKVALRITAPRLDFATRAITLEVRLVNESAAPVEGPLTVVLESIQESLPELRAANADNGRPGKGAEWMFPTGGAGPLPPNGVTPPRTLRFTFTGDVPDVPKDPIRALFSVFGKPAPRAAR